MFATIRRHQKWLWAGIIAVIIPSFVIFFTPDATLGRGGSASFGTINGRAISQREFATAYYETLIHYRLFKGAWPESRDSEDTDRDARNRVAILDLLKREKIFVNDEAAAKWIATTFTHQGAFRQETYLGFLREAREKGVSEHTLETFAAHQVGIQQLLAVYGSNGKLVTPREADSLFRREHEEYEAQVVLFSASNYLAGVTVDPQGVGQFFTNRLSYYMIPERVQVKYIRFDLASHQAEADKEIAKQTNLSQTIDAIYTQQGTNYYTDTNGVVLSEGKAKAKIKEQIHQHFLYQLASKEASAFAAELFKETNSAAIDKLAGAKYKVEITEPFNKNDGPRNLKVYNKFTLAAFRLSEEDLFAEPLDGEDGVYVIAFLRKLPAEYPALDAVKAKVTEDYRRYQAIQAARVAGISFQQQLTNNAAGAKTVAAAFAESKVKPVTLPKFSLSSREVDNLDPRLDLNMLKEIVSALPVGQASRFFDTRDGGFVVHLRAKLPVDAAKIKQELPEFVRTFAQSRQYDAFNDWLGTEIGRSGMQAPAKERGNKAN
jgi:hypothetical protein